MDLDTRQEQDTCCHPCQREDLYQSSQFSIRRLSSSLIVHPHQLSSQQTINNFPNSLPKLSKLQDSRLPNTQPKCNSHPSSLPSPWSSRPLLSPAPTRNHPYVTRDKPSPAAKRQQPSKSSVASKFPVSSPIKPTSTLDIVTNFAPSVLGCIAGQQQACCDQSSSVSYTTSPFFAETTH